MKLQYHHMNLCSENVSRLSEFYRSVLVAFPHAAVTGAIGHLATQWYVPVFAVPPLAICHVVCLILLLRWLALRHWYQPLS